MRAWPLVLAALLVPNHAHALDPSRAGRLPVGVTTLELTDASRQRVLVTEVWYPAAVAGRDTRVRRSHFPLVLVGHGYDGFRTNYEYLTTHLAAWGFVVAAPDFPGFNHTDVQRHAPLGDPIRDPERDFAFLAATLRDRSTPPRGFAAAVRGRRTGLVGHSLASIAVLGATIDDPRLSPAIVLAPAGRAFKAGDFGRVGRPIMSIGGTADATLPFDTQTAYLFGLLEPPAVLVKIVGGTHSGFTDVDGGTDVAVTAQLR
jgi:predicted dienelactone hydrolase